MSKFKIGDEVILIKDMESLQTGSIGFISVSTHWSGHQCYGLVQSNMGFFIEPKCLDLLMKEIPYDPSQQADQDDDI